MSKKLLDEIEQRLSESISLLKGEPVTGELTRLREENARLREAGQAVVDCFGVGLDNTQLMANIAYYVAGLAAALGDERATKALKVPS